MKKVVLAMLALSVVATGALAGCNHKKHDWSWGSDGSQHWQTCSGCDEKQNVGEHDYKVKTDGSKAWGACVCGKKLDNVVETMVMSSVKHAGDVKSGTTTFTSGTEGNMNTEYAETTNYEFRNGYFFVESAYKGEVQHTDYYMLKEDGSPYSVRVGKDDDGNEKLQQNPEEYKEENLLGYRFNSIIFDSELTFYGADSVISQLYKIAVMNKNGDFVESYKIVDGKVVGSFSFGEHDAADGYFFRLSIELVTNEVGFLESATLISNKYTTAHYKVVDGYAVPKTQGEYDAEYGDKKDEEDEEGEEGEEGAEGEEGEEEEIVQRDPNAEVIPFYNWEITISQSATCENANVPNPYDASIVLFKSVDFQFEDGTPVPDVVTMEATTRNIFYIRNLVPETAIAALNPETHTIDGQVADFLDPRLMIFYNKTDSYINVNALQQIGTYEVTFNFGALSKTFIIDVIPATPTQLDASVSDGNTFTPTDSAKTYEGMNLSFKPVAPADYYDTRVTLAITSGNEADATIVWDEELGEYVFNSTKIGTYVIEMASVKNPEVVATLTIEVEELPDVASLLSGTYQYTMKVAGREKVVYSVAFSPDNDGDLLMGTVEVTWTGNGTDVYAYTYDPLNGFQTEWIAGAETGVTIAMGSAFNLYVEREGTQYALGSLDIGGGDEVKDETASYTMYESFKIYSGVYENGMNLGGTWYSNAKILYIPDHPIQKTATKLTGSIQFTAGQDSFTATTTYEFTKSGGLTIGLAGGKWVNGDIEYVVTITSDNLIKITRTKTSTGSTSEWTLTQMSSEPDAYKNGTKEEIADDTDTGVSGDKLQGSGTMLDPYVLVDGANVALNLTSSAAHAVFTFTATSNGYLTFAAATNATVYLAEGVNGVISPVGDPLDIDTNNNPNHLSVTAGQTYYFMVYNAGSAGAVSFSFWVINA